MASLEISTKAQGTEGIFYPISITNICINTLDVVFTLVSIHDRLVCAKSIGNRQKERGGGRGRSKLLGSSRTHCPVIELQLTRVQAADLTASGSTISLSQHGHEGSHLCLQCSIGCSHKPSPYLWQGTKEKLAVKG
eukprot:268816-Amphidinium_carterae.1